MNRHFLLFIAYLIFQCAGVSGQTFTDSNLPIVVVNTNGQDLDGAWLDITVDMGIVDNGPGNRNHLSDAPNGYLGKVHMRLQGSSTAILPKKSYRVTTVDQMGKETSFPLMGLPSESDWVFKASYQDKSFLRDELAFHIFTGMGHYASRVRYFELVINGDYRGLYQLEEKIKHDKNRVNISKLTKNDLAGDDLTGGYIISLDSYDPGAQGWYSQYNSSPNKDSANYFLYQYPKPDSMMQVQKDYIKGFFDQMENTLMGPNYKDIYNGYRKFIDVGSFADNFIVNELSRNVDGYRRSTFFYKDKDSKGGRLFAGPIWDFNIAFGNASYSYGNSPDGWAYQQPSNQNFVPFWWWEFLSDSLFNNELRCRWTYWRSNILDLNKINQHIDSIANLLGEALGRNFQRWPIMGQQIYPEPAPVPQDYAGEIGYLKWWMQARTAWLDGNIPGQCFVGIAENSSDATETSAYPNPFRNGFSITYRVERQSPVKIELLNTLGEQVMVLYSGQKASGSYREDVAVPNLASGTYMVKLSVGEQVHFKKLVKVAE